MRKRVSRVKDSDTLKCQKPVIQLPKETVGKTPKRERQTDGVSDRETPERKRGRVLSVERKGVWTVMTEALTAGKHLTINL